MSVGVTGRPGTCRPSGLASCRPAGLIANLSKVEGNSIQCSTLEKLGHAEVAPVLRQEACLELAPLLHLLLLHPRLLPHLPLLLRHRGGEGEIHLAGRCAAPHALHHPEEGDEVRGVGEAGNHPPPPPPPAATTWLTRSPSCSSRTAPACLSTLARVAASASPQQAKQPCRLSLLGIHF